MFLQKGSVAHNYISTLLLLLLLYFLNKRKFPNMSIVALTPMHFFSIQREDKHIRPVTVEL
jgi:hypothetical protein